MYFINLSTVQRDRAGPKAAEAGPKRSLRDPLQNGPRSVLALGYLRGSLRQLQAQPYKPIRLIDFYS